MKEIHSHNSRTGIRGFHSRDWTETGIPGHHRWLFIVFQVLVDFDHLKHVNHHLHVDLLSYVVNHQSDMVMEI